MNSRSDTWLRDQLAVERTHLANERTLLAYVRTALGLLAAGVTILHFVTGVLADLGGAALVGAGLASLAVGVVRFRSVKRRLDAGG